MSELGGIIREYTAPSLAALFVLIVSGLVVCVLRPLQSATADLQALFELPGLVPRVFGPLLVHTVVVGFSAFLILRFRPSAPGAERLLRISGFAVLASFSLMFCDVLVNTIAYTGISEALPPPLFGRANVLFWSEFAVLTISVVCVIVAAAVWGTIRLRGGFSRRAYAGRQSPSGRGERQG